MTEYVINQRMGVVHRLDCLAVGRIKADHREAWLPEKAHLSPGVTHCPLCLLSVPRCGPRPPRVGDTVGVRGRVRTVQMLEPTDGSIGFRITVDVDAEDL